MGRYPIFMIDHRCDIIENLAENSISVNAYLFQTQLEDFIAKEDSKSKSESSSSRKSSLGSPISSDIEVNEIIESSASEEAAKDSFDDEPEIIEDEIEEIQISSEEKVSADF